MDEIKEKEMETKECIEGLERESVYMSDKELRIDTGGTATTNWPCELRWNLGDCLALKYTCAACGAETVLEGTQGHGQLIITLGMDKGSTHALHFACRNCEAVSKLAVTQIKAGV